MGSRHLRYRVPTHGSPATEAPDERRRRLRTHHALSAEEEELFASASDGGGLTTEATDASRSSRSSSIAATTCSISARLGARPASTPTRRSSARPRSWSATSNERATRPQAGSTPRSRHRAPAASNAMRPPAGGAHLPAGASRAGAHRLPRQLAVATRQPPRPSGRGIRSPARSSPARTGTGITCRRMSSTDRCGPADPPPARPAAPPRPAGRPGPGRLGGPPQIRHLDRTTTFRELHDPAAS